jgi:hypothetical protein
MKKCNKCKVEKDLKEFSKDKYSPDGIDYKCKECRKSHYVLDKANHQKRTKGWRDNNEGYFKKYFEENKESMSIYHREYSKSHKDVIKAWKILNPTYQKDYYNLNKDSILKYQNQRDKNQPHIRRWRGVLSLTLTRLNQNKKLDTHTLSGYSALDLKEHLDSLGMIWDYHQIDHKVPVTWFKEDTPPHIVNDLRNLQPLSPEENQIKGNRFSSNISEDYLELIKPFLKNNLEI